MSGHRVNPGDVLDGKYRVECILGAGGMGVVVAARHIDLGQRVALKFMLREAMGDPSHAERFLREAKAAVQLKSVHTARVLDVGRLRNGEPYMVMEYLDGRDLDGELQATGPMAPHVAVEYILQACEALAEAHGLGMIHRDVKLKNLFLTRTVDGRPLVKVLDFGLAKTLGGQGDVSLTATNSVFGSPQYMSPEQMRSAKDVDARSDIWSIGVCLYELLTGRVPFDAQGLAEICAMVLKDPLTPPSAHVRGLPLDLEAVVVRCLEKDPTHRYQTVADVAVALQPYAADEHSARRILTVMEAAQKLDHPTLVSLNAPPMGDGVRRDSVARTMSNWDSGLDDKTRRTRKRLSPGTLAAILGGMTVIALGSLTAGVIQWKAARSAAAASSLVESTPPPASAPLALPDPAPTPTNTPTPVAVVAPISDGLSTPPATAEAKPAVRAPTTRLASTAHPAPAATPKTSATATASGPKVPRPGEGANHM